MFTKNISIANKMTQKVNKFIVIFSLKIIAYVKSSKIVISVRDIEIGIVIKIDEKLTPKAIK